MYPETKEEWEEFFAKDFTGKVQQEGSEALSMKRWWSQCLDNSPFEDKPERTQEERVELSLDTVDYLVDELLFALGRWKADEFHKGRMYVVQRKIWALAEHAKLTE